MNRSSGSIKFWNEKQKVIGHKELKRIDIPNDWMRSSSADSVINELERLEL